MIINKSRPAAAPASDRTKEPAENGIGGPWPIEDDRARRDAKLRSILKAPEPLAPERRIDMNPKPIETDCSDVDAEEEHDLRRRGDKAFLIEYAKSLKHLCTHLPKNPYCTSCMRAKVNQK